MTIADQHHMFKTLKFVIFVVKKGTPFRRIWRITAAKFDRKSYICRFFTVCVKSVRTQCLFLMGFY